jgi:transcriptional regulator with XRE-family HTH domain
MPTDFILLEENLSDARRVKIARTIKGLRQTDVAYLAQCSVGLVSWIERGWRIPRKTRRDIFNILDLDPNDERKA